MIWDLLSTAAPYAKAAASYLFPQLLNAGGNALGSYIANKQNAPQQQMGPGQPGQQQQGAGDWFWGTQGQQFQYPRFKPNQESAMDFFLQQAMQNSDFGNIENLARENFQTKTVPSLAERFSGLSSGRPGSSRYIGALASAGRGLDRDLAALRNQYGLQQAKLGLQPSFDNVYLPGREGAGTQLAQTASDTFTKMLPEFFKWLQSGGGNDQQTPEQIRDQNIQKYGYQPMPPPQRAPISQYSPLPTLRG